MSTNNPEIEKRVIRVIAEHLGEREDAIGPQHSLLGDHGADSLDQFEISMALEEEFQIEIADEEFDKIDTVQDYISVIERHQLKPA